MQPMTRAKDLAAKVSEKLNSLNQSGSWVLQASRALAAEHAVVQNTFLSIAHADSVQWVNDLMGSSPDVSIAVDLPSENEAEALTVNHTFYKTRDGQKQFQAMLRAWGIRGLWDGTCYDPVSKLPLGVTDVMMLKPNARYIGIGSSTAGIKRFNRQLQSVDKRHKLELESALVLELNLAWAQPVIARPDLHILTGPKQDEDAMEIDAAAVGKGRAGIAEHEETAAAELAIIDEVRSKADLIAERATDPKFASTKYTHFQGCEIIPAVLFEHVKPELVPLVTERCREKGVMRFVRNGTSISRVPNVPLPAAKPKFWSKFGRS